MPENFARPKRTWGQPPPAVRRAKLGVAGDAQLDPDAPSGQRYKKDVILNPASARVKDLSRTISKRPEAFSPTPSSMIKWSISRLLGPAKPRKPHSQSRSEGVMYGPGLRYREGPPSLLH
jgi:hypothetical protein